MANAKATQAVGAVLVVGAGVAGMQASLDLANAGYLVHLVDKSPTIGGIMAQLDKTFPTNDCAMCIISPKLVEVGRHLNINILPNTQVETVDGEAGNFQVSSDQLSTLHRPGKVHRLRPVPPGLPGHGGE